MKLLAVCAYLLAIVLSNTLTASFAPLVFGQFIIPIGTFLIGFTFVLRDAVQYFVGRKLAYVTIFVAMILSVITSQALGDTLWIVFASAFTFVFSETVDTEIYTRLKMQQSYRVLFSGVAGSILDSAIFVIIGLSPLGANFISWEFVLNAILGQVIVKSLLQIFASLVIRMLEKRRMKEFSK